MKKLTAILTASVLVASMATTAMAVEFNQLVELDLWNANLDQPSMGNVATDNNPVALYNPTAGTLQVALNPVEVSGYKSGLTAMMYDTTGNGDYSDVTVLATSNVNIGTKFDGEDREITTITSLELELPGYLTMEGVEFLSIKMSVPYTPMDVVIGDGYLDARLRIDWNNMEGTAVDVLEPNTEISSGEVRSLTLESQGITLLTDTNALSEVTRMEVVAVTEGEDFDLGMSALEGEGTAFDFYRVYLTLGGTATTPTGTVSLVFPYENIDGLYRVNDNGSKTVLFGTEEEAGYTIMTRSIGLFAVAGGEKMVVSTPEVEETPEVETAPETTVSFDDVATHWAKENILSAVNLGLFNGTSDTTFSPDTYMTNSMVITVLHRMAGSPTAVATVDSWYGQAMAWGFDHEIIGGYTDFDPDANVTREALATMLFRYDMLNEEGQQGADLAGFPDFAEISDWALAGLSWANEMGIITGTGEGHIAPQDQASRAVVATMLCRYIG